MKAIMRRIWKVIALLVMCCVAFVRPGEQVNAQYLVTCYGDDVTQGIASLRLNDQGTAAAWLAPPEEFSPAFEQFGSYPNPNTRTPANVIVQSENARPLPIAGQPQDASFMDTSLAADNALVRSPAAWSPDGARFAYTEYTWGPEGPSSQIINIYDTRTGQITPVYELPYQVSSPPAPVSLQWSPAGILFYSFHAYPENFTRETDLIVINPDTGATIYTYDIPIDDPNAAVQSAFWIETGDGWQIGVILVTFDRFMIDPADGSQTPLDDATLEWRSARMADDAAGFALVIDSLADGTFQWAKIGADGALINIQYAQNFEPCPPLLSADGQSALWLNYTGEFFSWTGGFSGATGITLNEAAPGSLLAADWGWGYWQLRTGAPVVDAEGVSAAPLPQDNAYAFAITCPGFMPSRMVLGATGYVTVGGGANNLRELPSRDGALLGQIPEGAAFTVVEGPTCTEDMAWWRVNFNGIVGWTAEGQGDVYWLTPTL